MAIRAIIGFEHLPQGDTSWINYADHGINRAADLSVQNTIVDGWIVSNATTAGNERVNVPVSDYLVAPVNKIWFGVRVRLTAINNSVAGLVQHNSAWIFIITDIVGFANGVEAYLELSYDVTTGVCERRVNGVALANQQLTAGQRTVVIGLEAKNTRSNRTDWRDIYVCDDQGVAEGQLTGPLGPRKVAPIYGDAIVADTWTTTPEGTSLLAAVSTPGSIPTAAVATSAATPTPMTMSLSSSFSPNYNVDAIELNAGVSTPSGSATTIATKIKQGASEVAGKTIQAPLGSYNYSGLCGVFNRTPNGARWNPTSINETDLVLTPNA